MSLCKSASLFLVIASTTVTGWAQGSASMGASMPAKTMAVSASDKTFVTNAAIGGMTEVKLGELAASNGQSQAVKDFGKHMVDDHSKANDDLAGIAKGKGMSPPATPDAEHQKLIEKFAALKGAAFDKAYWNQMLVDHQKTIALFDKEASSGVDREIKSFASKTLPTIKMHLKMVQDAMHGKVSKMS